MSARREVPDVRVAGGETPVSIESWVRCYVSEIVKAEGLRDPQTPPPVQLEEAS